MPKASASIEDIGALVHLPSFLVEVRYCKGTKHVKMKILLAVNNTI